MRRRGPSFRDLGFVPDTRERQAVACEIWREPERLAAAEALRGVARLRAAAGPTAERLRLARGCDAVSHEHGPDAGLLHRLLDVSHRHGVRVEGDPQLVGEWVQHVALHAAQLLHPLLDDRALAGTTHTYEFEDHVLHRFLLLASGRFFD